MWVYNGLGEWGQGGRLCCYDFAYDCREFSREVMVSFLMLLQDGSLVSSLSHTYKTRLVSSLDRH